MPEFASDFAVMALHLEQHKDKTKSQKYLNPLQALRQSSIESRAVHVEYFNKFADEKLRDRKRTQDLKSIFTIDHKSSVRKSLSCLYRQKKLSL